MYNNTCSNTIKEEVKERDSHRCVDCGTKDKLQIHHVDFNATNNKLDNLLTLCVKCHRAVHRNAKNDHAFPLDINHKTYDKYTLWNMFKQNGEHYAIQQRTSMKRMNLAGLIDSLVEARSQWKSSALHKAGILGLSKKERDQFVLEQVNTASEILYRALQQIIMDYLNGYAPNEKEEIVRQLVRMRIFYV